MAPDSINEIFERYPDTPLRITLSSGDKIDIPNGTAGAVSISHIFLFPNLKRRFTPDLGRYISVVNVAMIEPIAEVGGGLPSQN